MKQRLKLPHIAFNRKVGAFAAIEAAPDGATAPGGRMAVA